MKNLFLFLIILPGFLQAQLLSTRQITQVNSLVTTVTAPLNTKITTLTNQAATLTATNAAQDKTIVILQAQLKAYSIDSAATKKRLSDAEKALLAKDTQFTNLNKNYSVLFDQNGTLYSRTDSLNKRVYDAAAQIAAAKKRSDSLQTMIDEVQDVAVKAMLEANQLDSLKAVPGEITLTQTSPTGFSIGVYNYSQLNSRLQILEAALQKLQAIKP